MRAPREVQRSGVHYLSAVTALLQRGRSMHPTKGLYEAAEVQWWWARPRSTDDVAQLFWFDGRGRPEAAVIITDWRDWVTLDVITLPDATLDWVAKVVERGLAHAAASGFDKVQLEIDRTDDVLREILVGHGFRIEDPEELVESWMVADDRPGISAVPDGYRLATRAATTERSHHMAGRMGPDVEQRLQQTSLYRPDLDLLVLDSDDHHAASGLFWFDPVTSIGVVEPMHTEDEHRRRGLARHILTAGVDLLATAGAERIKICYDSDNPASGHLYRSAGFEPVKQTDVYAGQTMKPSR